MFYITYKPQQKYSYTCTNILNNIIVCIHQHSIYSFKLVRIKIQNNNNKKNNTSNKTLGERYHNLLLQEKNTKTKKNNNAYQVVTKLTINGGVWGGEIKVSML